MATPPSRSFATLVTRLQSLSPSATAEWGKMNVAQMLAHCQKPLGVALGDHELKRSFIGLVLGRLFRGKATSAEPFQRNLPTDRSFVVREPGAFASERDRLVDLIQRFGAANPQSIAARPHPFFGRMTAEQWQTLMWKHVDHHLRQFGA